MTRESDNSPDGEDEEPPLESEATPYYEVLEDPEELVGEWLLPACPLCGDGVAFVHTIGPHESYAHPCGCRVRSDSLRRP